MRLLAWLLCFAPLLGPIYSEDTLFGIVKENFTFPVEIKQRIEEITWKKNKDIVAEWDGQKPPTYFTSLKDRSVLKENGNLTIFNLEKSDAGTYELHYWDSVNDGYLKFILDVLDPPSEPEISCRSKGDNVVLNCTSDFQRPVNYTWKLSNDSDLHSQWSQEFSIPIKDIDATKKATCSITFSQTEKSSEISLMQCISDKKGYVYHKRDRSFVIMPVVFVLGIVVLLVYYIRGRSKCKRGGVAQKNSPVHGSGEHEQLFSGENQEQHNSDRATFSQRVHCENESPEAEREWNKEDSALKDVQTVTNGVSKEELSAMQNSTPTSKWAVDDGVTAEITSGTVGAECLPCLAFAGSIKDHEGSAIKYGEPTRVAEGENGEHLNNSPSGS